MSDLSQAYADEVSSLLEEPTAIDFEHAHAMAKRHKVLPMVNHNLVEGRLIDRLPEPARVQLQASADRNHRRNEYLLDQLTAIVERIRARGVEVLVRKGLPLAVLAYRCRSLRAMGDVDLLVRKQDVRDVVALLQEDGFEPWMPLDAQRMLILGGLNYPTMSRNVGSDVCTALHVGLSVAYFEHALRYPYDIDAVFARARTAEPVEGLPVADGPDFFVDVCAHFVKDAKSLASIEWGTDLLLYRFSDVARLARLVTAAGEWQTYVDRVLQSGVATPVYFALWYAGRVDPSALAPDAEALRGAAVEETLDVYGETERAIGRWDDDRDVVGRLLDEDRRLAFTGSSRWAAAVPPDPTPPPG